MANFEEGMAFYGKILDKIVEIGFNYWYISIPIISILFLLFMRYIYPYLFSDRTDYRY